MAMPLKLGLNIIASTNKVPQRPMTYEKLFSLFLLCHKGTFLRLFLSLNVESRAAVFH
jgi:hypothetical protein